MAFTSCSTITVRILWKIKSVLALWSCSTIILLRQWSASWSWNASVMVSAAHALCGHVGLLCLISGAQEITWGRSTTWRWRSQWTRMAQGLWLQAGTSKVQRKTNWCTWKTLQTIASWTEQQVGEYSQPLSPCTLLSLIFGIMWFNGKKKRIIQIWMIYLSYFSCYVHSDLSQISYSWTLQRPKSKKTMILNTIPFLFIDPWAPCPYPWQR